MKSKRERDIERMFRVYRSNARALKDDFNFPSISAVDFSRVAIQTDKSRNMQEDLVINYADKKTKLFAEVFIVEETLQWFRLEGHGRERFIQHFLIENNGWVSTEMHCSISRDTLSRWRHEVFEKAEMLGKWIGYYNDKN